MNRDECVIECVNFVNFQMKNMAAARHLERVGLLLLDPLSDAHWQKNLLMC